MTRLFVRQPILVLFSMSRTTKLGGKLSRMRNAEVVNEGSTEQPEQQSWHEATQFQTICKKLSGDFCRHNGGYGE